RCPPAALGAEVDDAPLERLRATVATDVRQLFEHP
ncbi:MAG: hypothetical protein ACI9R3_002981, partial [Verrucomicrobiales bacterium]